MLRKRKLCMYIEEPDCELYEAIGDTQKNPHVASDLQPGTTCSVASSIATATSYESFSRLRAHR